MRLAGRGSYGSVYKVWDRVTGQIVAAKVRDSAALLSVVSTMGGLDLPMCAMLV